MRQLGNTMVVGDFDSATASTEHGDVDKYHDERITEIPSNATSEASDEDRTLGQNIKKYRKVVYITLALTSAILLYGYDNVVVGTVSGMPRFQYVLLQSMMFFRDGEVYMCGVEADFYLDKTSAKSTMENGSYPHLGSLSGTLRLLWEPWLDLSLAAGFKTV